MIMLAAWSIVAKPMYVADTIKPGKSEIDVVDTEAIHKPRLSEEIVFALH